MTKAALVLLPLLALLCLVMPAISSAIALALGVALAVSLGNPYLGDTRKWTPILLQASVIGLGAAMDLRVVARVGAQGFVYTAAGIILTCALGLVFGKLLKIERTTSLLITVGTAICGGSAIAAVGAAVRAKSEEMSVSLGTVFVLNSVALLIFPPLGHAMHMDQSQFGLWCALAIHDTSSVVGAAMQFGTEALQIATTVKLSRALWIVPMTLLVSWIYSRRQVSEAGAATAKVKPKRPWFILGFLLAAAITTWVPSLHEAGEWVSFASKRGLVLVLFLIGCGLTPATLKAVGIRPFAQGVLLWIVAASASALAILMGGVT
jgi:uncharacterized integral membrane protein (TIGR00698 family)